MTWPKGWPTFWPTLWPDGVLPLGLRGERHAARVLRRMGYRIVAGGARSRFGEIDLIAVQGRTIVFVEVKTRRSDRAGAPAEAVNAAKQRRISASALAFLKTHGLLEHRARFDVIAIIWPADAREPSSVEHFKNAFEPPGFGQFYS